MAQRGMRLPNLKTLRLRAGMTQGELAEASEVAASTINRIERLDAPAEVRTARALAQAIGCNVADLMGEQ